jgi:hypothetical protein
MERYPASIGQGIFLCRFGYRPGVGGGSFLDGVPIPTAVAAKPESPVFSAVSRAGISRSACYDRASMASGDNRH